MSKGFITRRSGDSYDQGAFAQILASYQAGSLCTCSLGGRVLKAKNKLGYWVFNLPYGGEWVVSCTDGTDTDSKTVSITTEGQSESVELSYGYYLFREGVFENGHDVNLNNSNGGIHDVLEDSIHIIVTGFQYCYPQFSGAVDLTHVSSVFVRFRSNSFYTDSAGSYMPGAAIYLSKSANDVPWENPHAQINTIDAGREYELSIDTSAMAGNYYVSLRFASQNTGYTMDVNIISVGVRE